MNVNWKFLPVLLVSFALFSNGTQGNKRNLRTVKAITWRWRTMCLFWTKKEPVTSAKELAEKCETPEKISAWTRRNIWYEKDEKVHGVKEWWQTSDETLRLMTGDCEDFVILQHDSLKELGFKPLVVSVHISQTEAHAVCVITHNGNIYHLSNWKMTRCWDADDMRGVGKYVFKNWRYITIWDVDNIVNGKAKQVRRIHKGVYL